MTHPAEVITVRCLGPNCEQIKREANHWFLLWKDTSDGMFHCVPYSPEMFEEVGEVAKPACGSACAQKLFERFLRTGEI